MFDVKERLMEDMLVKTIKKAKLDNERKLLSITKKTKAIDPLRFFETVGKMGRDRVFWSSNQGGFTIVGSGQVARIEAIEAEDSLKDAEINWHKIIDQAIIYNPYETVGTGILALGGMSFDPLKARSDLWQKFHPSDFVVPEIMLTKDNDAYYYTINMQVEETAKLEKLLVQFRKLEQFICMKQDVLPSSSGGILLEKEIEPIAWKETIVKAKQSIEAGQADKIVLAREIRVKLAEKVQPTFVLKKLLKDQLNSYVFAFERAGDCFIGATPERLAKLSGKQLLSTCLAGTAPRGETKSADEKLSKDLLEDEKNREEHAYVVQMIKAAIEGYCTNIKIPSAPVIYPLKNLQHLYTPVTAELKDSYSVFDIIRKLHPTPALGGTPRQPALAFIRENELLDRGWYGAPIGFLDSNGNSEFAVAIRSGLIQADEVSLFAGCGVVKSSDPETEYQETKIKFLPMLQALGG